MSDGNTDPLPAHTDSPDVTALCDAAAAAWERAGPRTGSCAFPATQAVCLDTDELSPVGENGQWRACRLSLPLKGGEGCRRDRPWPNPPGPSRARCPPSPSGTGSPWSCPRHRPLRCYVGQVQAVDAQGIRLTLIDWLVGMADDFDVFVPWRHIESAFIATPEHYSGGLRTSGRSMAGNHATDEDGSQRRYPDDLWDKMNYEKRAGLRVEGIKTPFARARLAILYVVGTPIDTSYCRGKGRCLEPSLRRTPGWRNSPRPAAPISPRGLPACAGSAQTPETVPLSSVSVATSSNGR